MLKVGYMGTLSDILDHSDIDVTKKSYARFRPGELQAEHDRFSPICDLDLDDKGAQRSITFNLTSMPMCSVVAVSWFTRPAHGPMHDECPDCGAPLKEAYPWLHDEGPRDVHPEYPEIPKVGGWYPDETPPEEDKRLVGTNPRDWKDMVAPNTGTASLE